MTNTERGILHFLLGFQLIEIITKIAIKFL